MQIISLILLDSDLTRGWYCPTFEHLGLSWVTQVLVLTTSRSNGLRAWGASERTAEIEPYSFWMQISNYDILSTKSCSHLPSTCSEHREQTISQAVAYKRLKTMDNYKTVTQTGYSAKGFSIYRKEIIQIKESLKIFFSLLSMLRSDWLSHY